MGDPKANYRDYMITDPVDVGIELNRLSDADYELCAVFLTMLLGEDYFCNGEFEIRYSNGQITPIIEKMVKLL